MVSFDLWYISFDDPTAAAQPHQFLNGKQEADCSFVSRLHVVYNLEGLSQHLLHWMLGGCAACFCDFKVLSCHVMAMCSSRSAVINAFSQSSRMVQHRIMTVTSVLHHFRCLSSTYCSVTSLAWQLLKSHRLNTSHSCNYPCMLCRSLTADTSKLQQPHNVVHIKANVEPAYNQTQHVSCAWVCACLTCMCI